MIKISQSEQQYVLKGVEKNIRADARERFDFRRVVLETGVLNQSHGSARLSLHDASTDVLVSVKAEMSTPSALMPDSGQLFISVSVSPSVSAKLEGRAVDEMNTELSLLLQRLLCSHESLDLKALCFISGSKAWTLYIDVRVFDVGGNLPDAISIATYAALRDTLLPQVSVVGIEEEHVANQHIEVNADPATGVPLDLASMPLCLTLFKLGSYFVVDATLEEEECSEARLCVAIDAQGRVGGVQKLGQGSLQLRQMQAMIDTAKKLARECFDALEDALVRQAERQVSLRPDQAVIGFFSS